MQVSIFLRVCNAMHFAWLALFTLWSLYKGGWGELIAIFFLPFVLIAGLSLWAALGDCARVLCLCSALLLAAVYGMFPYIAELGWAWRVPLIIPVLTLAVLFPECLAGAGRPTLRKYLFYGKLCVALLAVMLWFHHTSTALPLVEMESTVAQSPVFIEKIRFNDSAWAGVESADLGYGPPRCGGGGWDRPQHCSCQGSGALVPFKPAALL